MKYILIVFSLFFFSCNIHSPQDNKLTKDNGGVAFDIGTSYEDLRNFLGDSLYILGPSLNLRNGYVLNYSDVNFLVTFDRENRINYLFTNDSLFTTSDNISVGMSFEKLISYEENVKLDEIRGWAKFCKLNSGWYAAFPIDNKKQNLKIQFLFKYESW